MGIMILCTSKDCIRSERFNACKELRDQCLAKRIYAMCVSNNYISPMMEKKAKLSIKVSTSKASNLTYTVTILQLRKQTSKVNKRK